MVRLSLVVQVLAAIPASLAVRSIRPNHLPGAYVVELEDGHDSDSFLASVSDQASKRLDLNYELFKGVSIQLHDVSQAEDTASKLLDMAPVKAIWPVKLYPVPEHEVLSTGGPDSPQLRRRATGPDTFSPHLMTQINLLRDKGIIGTNVKVGVLDTGVDYLHPALGGCFGSGCLVSYGTDLVGDAYTGYNTPVPDPDPMDCAGHGTHVSGIIAAQPSNPWGIIGAASGVHLGMFRVFGCDGDSGTDVLLAAWNQAYEAGSDIITASLGANSGWSEDPLAVVVQRIVEKGVPCTVSAGNDGPEGLFYFSSSATGRGVAAIASVDNYLAPVVFINGTYTVDGGAPVTFGYTVGTPGNWGNVSLPLWALDYDTTNPADGCKPFPDSTPDLSGYIVLIRRGTCTLASKAANAAAKGAKYVILYNNAPGATSPEATDPRILAFAMVTADQGATWIAELKAGDKVIVTMSDPKTTPNYVVSFSNKPTGGFLSSYTTWGPTFDLEVKPQIGGVGGLILSTWPRALGSYAVISGTSMSCPMLAGIHALIMQARGTKDPQTILNLLSSTANPNLFQPAPNTSAPYLAPVAQQGAGLVQAYDAAYSTTLLSINNLAFNDTDHFNGTQHFTISNQGDKAVTYTLSNVGAATAYTFNNSITPMAFPNTMTTQYATIAFAPAVVALDAGATQVVTVTAVPPQGLDASRLPVYSGYLAINGTDGSSLSVPYLGVVGSMKSLTVLDANNTYLYNSTDQDFNPAKAGQTYILPPRGHSNETAYENQTLPAIAITLAMGSAVVHAYVVPVQLCKPANTTTQLGTKTIGDINQYPATYMPRGGWGSPWDGELADGTFAPAGVYKFAVKALHIFGNPANSADYDTTESVPFRIRYMKG